ncbi:MAG TPA: hypothetical protein VF885_08270 [Arthrobacter sp.]
MILSAEAIDAAKAAMQEVTPPPGVSKADWLAEHGSFALIAGAVAAAAPFLSVPAPRVLTTEDELNSEEAFASLCIMPRGGPLRTAISRSNGVNTWQEPGWNGEQTSAELLAHFAAIGAEPHFTLIEG